MLNHIVLMGRLTKDPDIRFTQTDKPVTNFRIAVDRDFSDGTDFIAITAWNKTAEFVHKYFTKGSLIVISGRLQMNSYTDKQGQNRTDAEVVAEHVYFGESKQRASQPITRGISVTAEGFTDIDDAGDLPF